MNRNHLFASAAVAAVLVMTAPAHAQVHGGGVRGGAGGAFAGGIGGMRGMGEVRGGMSAAADTSLHENVRARRSADTDVRDAKKVGTRASDSTQAVAREGLGSSVATARATETTGVAQTTGAAQTARATEGREAAKLGTNATAATAATVATAPTAAAGTGGALNASVSSSADASVKASTTH
jgi:hypothetical protein